MPRSLIEEGRTHIAKAKSLVDRSGLGPLLTSVAMRHVGAVHAAVIIGLLPLATAASSSFTAMRMAWKLRLAGCCFSRRA